MSRLNIIRIESHLQSEKGASTLEYAMLTTLLAVICIFSLVGIGRFPGLGPNAAMTYENVALAMGGGTSSSMIGPETVQDGPSETGNGGSTSMTGTGKGGLQSR